MLTYFDAALNGEWLSALDESIYVLDVRDRAVERVLSSAWEMKNGLRFHRRIRSSLSVTIVFYIATPDPSRRAAVLQDIQAWARKGGTLEVNARTDQTLQVKCESLPLITSASKWTDQLTMTFTAYEFPFWRDRSPATVTISANGSMQPGGAVDDMPCDVKITNTGSAAITSLRVSAGETFLAFEGISLPAGGALDITHDEKGILYARIGDTSVLNARTTDSSDDLFVSGGEKNALSVTANGSITAKFTARGVYP